MRADIRAGTASLRPRARLPNEVLFIDPDPSTLGRGQLLSGVRHVKLAKLPLCLIQGIDVDLLIQHGYSALSESSSSCLKSSAHGGKHSCSKTPFTSKAKSEVETSSAGSMTGTCKIIPSGKIQKCSSFFLMLYLSAQAVLDNHLKYRHPFRRRLRCTEGCDFLNLLLRISAREASAFLCREVLVKLIHLLIINIITLRRLVYAGDAVKITGEQFFAKKESSAPSGRS